MHWTYILKNLKSNRYYVGSTADVQKRLNRHNKGANIATRYGIPWILIHQECFQTRNEAYRREMKVKSYKSGDAFKKLIKGK